MKLLLLKKSNKFLLIIFFIIIFTYYQIYPVESTKEFLLITGAVQDLKLKYGLWGFINDSLYDFFDLILGKKITGFILVGSILAFQISFVWSIIIFKLLKDLNYISIILFFHPFVLNFFSLCTRDAFALALFFLIAFKSWDSFKLLISILISFSIHKAILPFILTSDFVSRNKEKSKRYFIFMALISIFISIIIFSLLRYTNIISFLDFLPLGEYKLVLSYPRMGLTDPDNISQLSNKAYNFFGNFNLKILSFGLLGQFLSIIFKENFIKNSFSLSFSSFFICSALSSIPNADRFIYHAVLISFPYLIYISIEFFKRCLKKIFENQI